MGTLTTITEPASEPVTLAEVKESLRVLHTDDDALIGGLITSARRWAEHYLNRRIISQVVQLNMHAFSGNSIYLGLDPIISIDSVKYDDTASPITEQTLVVNTDYYADIITKGGYVTTLTGWPSTARRPNSARILATVGYSSADAVPEIIKEGIKIYIASKYDRDPELVDIAKELLWPERFITAPV